MASSDMSWMTSAFDKSIKSSLKKSADELAKMPDFIKYAKEYAFFRIRITYLKSIDSEKYEAQKKSLKDYYLSKFDKYQKNKFIDIAMVEYDRLKNDPTSEYEKQLQNY